MANINTRRRSLEEAARRRTIRQRAERLSDNRGRFNQFMKERGMSEEQRERELRRLDEQVEAMQDMAEDGAIDERSEAW